MSMFVFISCGMLRGRRKSRNETIKASAPHSSDNSHLFYIFRLINRIVEIILHDENFQEFSESETKTFNLTFNA